MEGIKKKKNVTVLLCVIITSSITTIT